MTFHRKVSKNSSKAMSSIRDFFPIDYKVGGTKPKKNFVLENKKFVAKLSKSTQASKENENPSKKLSCANTQKVKLMQGPNKDLIPEKSKKFDLDKIDASIKSIRSAIAQTKITQEKLSIKNHENVSLAFKDQATQTIHPYDEENILRDNIVRFPKSKDSDIDKVVQMKHINTIAVQTDSSKSKYSESVSEKKNDFNLKKNKQNSVGHKENQHQLGEIPKYLKNLKVLKEKNDLETQKKLAIRRELGLDDPACPPGHILLPEPERLDHLAKIKKDYGRLIMQLNMLPVSSDSYKMKEKRKHLEKELDKLQLGIRLFSREKLFVKANPKFSEFYK